MPDFDESPMGFHILHCFAIEAACELPLASVRGKIRKHITEFRRRASQKAWTAGLFKKERVMVDVKVFEAGSEAA